MNLISGVHYDLVWCKVAILENDGSEVDIEYQSLL